MIRDVRTAGTRGLLVALCAAGLLFALAPAPRAGLLDALRVVVAGGDRYVSLNDVATTYGCTLRIPPGRSLFLQSKWIAMAFESESREAHINGVTVWLHSPVMKIRGKWVVSESDVRKVIDPILRPSAWLASRGRQVVVLDPGHGFQDRGASGRHGVEEKRVVLDIARRARVHLANAGLKVYMTRESDRFIELEDRSEKSGKWGAQIFVSIHLNSAASAAPKGIETYVLAAPGYPPTAASAGSRVDRVTFPGNRFDQSSTILGYSLQRALLEKTKSEDRGLRRARFVVLKNAPCPAALVECGFLSNPSEEAKMLTNEHREKIALAISKGILDYVNAVKKAQAAAKSP